MIVEGGWSGIGVGDIMINFARIGQESKKRRRVGGRREPRGVARRRQNHGTDDIIGRRAERVEP